MQGELFEITDKSKYFNTYSLTSTTENSNLCCENKEKSKVDCVNNQPCLFDHRVSSHTAVLETILCDNSPEESKEQRTMFISEDEVKPKQSAILNQQPKQPVLYSQDWTNYNLAQTNEKTRFLELLYELCSQIDDLPRKNIQGRNRIPLADMIFAVVFKTYSIVSARRFMSDLSDAHRKGFISKIPHFNSIFNYLEMDEMYSILKFLITESAKPLKDIEVDFAVDSSGFAKGTTVKWIHAKYSNPHVIDKKDWLKCHLMCGVTTNVVTSIEVTNGNASDSPRFKPLVEETAKTFKINEVSADKAYLSAKNLRLVSEKGGMPFIPFKENSRPHHRSGEAIWRTMYYFFQMHQEKFMSYYHKRSNVETTFFMIKTKFGEKLKSKTEKAQINELLCKVLCHNICCVISAIYELGLEPDFYRD